MSEINCYWAFFELEKSDGSIDSRTGETRIKTCEQKEEFFAPDNETAIKIVREEYPSKFLQAWRRPLVGYKTLSARLKKLVRVEIAEVLLEEK